LNNLWKLWKTHGSIRVEISIAPVLCGKLGENLRLERGVLMLIERSEEF
jgi:hypothetical protein